MCLGSLFGAPPIPKPPPPPPPAPQPSVKTAVSAKDARDKNKQGARFGTSLTIPPSINIP